MLFETLIQLLNEIPPEKLGSLVSQVRNPQRYVNDDLLEGRRTGYRGNLPLQMSGMRGGVGGRPITPPRRS